MTNLRPNPYPGPRPFKRGETLYGRRRETTRLLDLLIAERVVLLCSPSGAGKTSLVQAALIPEMERERFRVLPVMRPGLAPDEAAAGANRYILKALQDLEDGLHEPAAEDRRVPLAELTAVSMTDYLARIPAPAGGDWHGDLLIFDQFEEVLTLDPTDQEAKLAFFEQVGQALRDHNRWALFSMREEYVAALDPYLRPIPARFDKGRRYRLDLLSPGAARAAIQGPCAGQNPPVTFTAAAADRLVDDLRQTQVQQPDGTMSMTLGREIEPVQLQVVCRQLWDNLAADDDEIDTNDVEKLGDVDQALRGYYAATVREVARATELREPAVRVWFEDQLITKRGIRNPVPRGYQRSPEGDDGLDNLAIAQLEQAHLVRAEQRRGVTWYELGHDRLIEPVRSDNAQWFEEHLSTLQRQAKLWVAQRQPPGLLLLGEELATVEQWAQEHDAELERHDRAFLAASRAAEEKRRQLQRIRRQQMTIIALILGAVAVAALVGFLLYFRETLAARTALSRQLAAQSADHLDDQYDLALLLSLAANQVAQTMEARGSLLAALEHERQLAQFLREPGETVSSVAFSPDGAWLVTAGSREITGTDNAKAWTGAVTLWDAGAEPLRLKTRLASPSSPVVTAIFSPDSRSLAAGCEDGTIHVWRLHGESTDEMTWAAHGQRVNSMSFSPDGRWLASAGKTDVVLWDLTASAQPAPTHFLAGEAMCSVAFSPDSHTLAVGFADGRISLQDVVTQDAVELARSSQDGQANSLAFSPDGQKLAAARSDKSIIVWDLAARRPMTLTGHQADVEAVSFSSDGRLLASGSQDTTVRLWDMATGQQLGSALSGHTRWVMGVAFHPDGKRLASVGYDGSVILWHTAAAPRLGRSLAGLHDAQIWAVAVSPDARKLASGGKDGRVVLWDLTSGAGTEVGRLAAPVRTLAFSPDEAILASGDQDGYVRLWAISGSQARERDRLLHAQGQFVTDVAFSPDGHLLASASFDKLVKLWDLKSNPPISRTLAGHTGQVWSVAFSRDGKSLASSDDKGQIILWDLAQGHGQGRPFAGLADVKSIDFSPDGKLLAGGGKDRLVLVWDVGTGQPIATLERHTGDISGVAFSPDGRTLASSSYDGTVILWDVATARLIGEPVRGHSQPVNGVAFSPDGRLLADASDDCTLTVWDMDLADWQALACQVANRNLTTEEWQQYVGGQPYQRTCPEDR